MPHRSDISSELRVAWERRASEKGKSLEGVLYRGLGHDLNQYIHKWHVWVVSTRLLPLLSKGALVLDLGCGYGRIRSHIMQDRPDLRVVGLDFSKEYCFLHVKTFKAATVCADMANMPFGKEIFDGILGVTSLMYLDVERRRDVIGREILAAIKPGGFGLFIDPELELMSLARLLKPASGKTPTKGEGFRLKDYLGMDKDSKWKTLGSGGIPLFTFLLPALILCRSHHRLTKSMLTFIQRADFSTKPFQKLSLQRWVLLERHWSTPSN